MLLMLNDLDNYKILPTNKHFLSVNTRSLGFVLGTKLIPIINPRNFQTRVPFVEFIFKSL